MPELITVPGRLAKTTPLVLPVISPVKPFVTVPPADRRMPLRLVPKTLPLFVTVPKPPVIKIPAPLAPAPVMVPVALFVTLPPANKATPSSTGPLMTPEFVTVPTPPWMMTPSSPPKMVPVLVTLPPLVKLIP